MRPDGGAVVLVHGLWLSGWAVGCLAGRLRRSGFSPRVFSYPSVHRGLRDNAVALRAFGDAIEGDVAHFVGHSLGGVIIQAMLGYCPPTRPGRVVTLCAPHQGSRSAQVFARLPLGTRALGASMADLLAGRMPAGDLAGREVGLIKGDRPFGTGRLFARFEEPNDGVVALSEMRLPGAADEIVLHASHSGVLMSRRAAEHTDHFLRFGRFIK